MLKTDLWRCNYKRLAVVSQHLSSQNMEVVSWSGALSNLEVDILSRQVVKLSTDCVISLRVDIL